MEIPIKNGWFVDTTIFGNIHIISGLISQQEIYLALYGHFLDLKRILRIFG